MPIKFGMICTGSGCSCSTPTSFCVYDCNATPISGATVTVSGVGSCTTGAGGCCQITLATGTYTVTATVGGTTIYSQSLSITQGNTYSISPNCCVKVCLRCCDGSVYPYGATVTVKNASTGATVATGTTDATGCVTVGFASSLLSPAPNQATIAIMPNCSLYAGTSAAYSPVCGQTISLTVPAADSTAICCSNQGSCIPIKTNLTITDANGSHPFIYQPGAGHWYACYLTNASPTFPTTWNTTLGQCQTNTSVTGSYPTRVEYYGSAAPCYGSLGCGTPPSDTFAVIRIWYLDSDPVGGPAVYHGAAASPSACDGCKASIRQCSFGTAPMPTGCSAFAVSVGSLTPAAANHSIDPVGGGVSVS